MAACRAGGRAILLFAFLSAALLSTACATDFQEAEVGVDGTVTQQPTDATATVPGTESAEQLPADAPTTGPPVDPLVSIFPRFIKVPMTAVGSWSRCIFRGLLHGVRDVLHPVSRSSDNKSPLDTQASDESEEEFARRKGIKDWILTTSLRLGSDELLESNPSLLRYGVAGALGLLGMATLGLVQLLAASCARGCMYGVFRLTNDPSHLAEEDYERVVTRMQEEEERREKLEKDDRAVQGQAKQSGSGQQRSSDKGAQGAGSSKKGKKKGGD